MRKKLIELAMIALTLAVMLSVIFITFIFAVVQTSERIEPVTAQEING